MSTPVHPAFWTDAMHEASLDEMLTAWDGREPVWVFGYGSLIWRPEFAYDAKVRGLVHGYHRSLCLWSRIYRGTPEKPGLVLALEPGGSVHGVAFRLPADDTRTSLKALWKRELATGSYVPRWLAVRSGDASCEPMRAIGFVMNRAAAGYAGELDRDTLLDTVCTARGRNGTCAEYLLSTVKVLAEYDIHDRHLSDLARDVDRKVAGRVGIEVESA